MRTRAVFILLLTLPFIPLRPGGGACAQTPESSMAEQDGNPMPPDPEQDEEDVIYRRGPDGRPSAVPVTDDKFPTIDELLKSPDDSQPPVPDYFLSNLTLDGQVVDNWAELTAEIEIRVVAEDRWLRVPLRFDQASLFHYTHRGDGEAAPAATDDTESGMTWMLKGQGVHTLSLKLRVPLRKTSNGSQLQLVVPELPDLFAGEFRLKIPGDQLAIQPGEDIHLLEEPRKIGRETIVLSTLSGDRVDLRWHPVVEEANPISQTLTHLTVRLRDQRIVLSARQEVWLRQTGLPSVEVRLPSGGFQSDGPVRISDTSGAERQVYPVAAEREGWARVPLDGVIGTAVSFDWSFEMPMDDSFSELTVDGLEVAGAADQSGTIALEGFDRHVLTRQAKSGGGVSRISVDELPAAGAFANLAYRFQTGGYQLVLDVDRMESTFRVTPIYVLNLSELRTDLTARFLVSIDEGQVDALPLKWPQFADQGWDVEPLAVGGGDVRRDEISSEASAEESSAQEPAPEPTGEGSSVSRWLLKPAGPLENGSEIGLSAQRTTPLSDESDPLEIVLPKVTEGRMLPAMLFVTMSDNIQADVKPQPGVTLTPRSTSPLVPASVLEDLADRSQLSYELVPEDQQSPLAVNVTMTVQPRQVRMGSIVTVENVDTKPRVTQTIDIDVSFGRLSSVRLKVPPLLVDALSNIPDEARSEAAALQFQVGSESLPATSVDWNGPEVELTLPTAMRGPFQVTIGGYTTPALQSHAESVEIPIISSVGRSFDSVKLVIPDLETVSVDISDNQWTKVPTTVSGAEWITRSSPEAVTLALDKSLEAVPQQMTIPLAVIRSNMVESGMVHTVAQYQVDVECTQIVIELPSDAQRIHFMWNGQEVETPFLTEQQEIANHFLVEFPDGPLLVRSWFRVSYVIGNQPLGWTQRSEIPFPRFGERVAIERTLWEVKLPQSQHLLTPPRLLSQLYSWSRSGLVWSRSPAPDYREERHQLTADGVDEVFSVETGNVYPFETFGTLTEVNVKSMSNSLLVFLGAGLTLVASFLVLKVPAARSLWFWLFWGTLLTALSLWHLETILLLLQPVAYGLLLPICAALFEFMTDRKTISSPSLSTHGSFELTLPAADDSQPSVGSSHDPTMPSTLVRPTALSDSGRR